jgi:tape measure domain-containing protein
MATATEKTLKIRIVTQLSGEDAFKKLGTSIDSDNAKINQFSTTLKKNKDGVDVYTHSIELASKSLNDLRIAKAATDAAFRNSVKNNNPLISENPFKDFQKAQQTEQTRRLNLFQQGLREAEAKLRASIENQKAIERDGANSIASMKSVQKEKERLLNVKLYNELDAIRKRFLAGETNYIKQAQERNVALRNYEQGVTRLNTRTQERIRLLQEQAALEANVARVMRLGHEAAANAIRNTNNAVKETTKEHRSLLTHITEIYSIYTLINIAATNLKQALLNIPKAGINQQATQASIFGIFGTDDGSRNLAFLQEIANKAGQNIRILEEAYKRYAPSARLAGAAQEDINKSFRDFAEVGTILHLPEDKLNSLFLALDQMFAKGVVQSEEIKKQLGNVLPGAVEIGARAMGKTPAAFMEAMKKNEVTAKEFVPKFAEQYRKIFGGDNDKVFTQVSDQFYSNLQRILNQYENFNRQMFQKSQDWLNTVVRGIGNGIKWLNENLSGVLQIAGLVSSVLLTKLAVSISVVTARTIAGTAANLAYAGSLARMGGLIGPPAPAIGTWGKLSDILRGTLVLARALINPFTIVAATVAAIGGGALALAGVNLEYSKLINYSKEELEQLQARYAAGDIEAGKQLERLNRLTEDSKSFLLTFKGEQIQVSSLLEAMWNRIKLGASAAWEVVKDYGTKSWEAVKAFGTLVIDDFKAGFDAFGKFIYKAIVDNVSSAMSYVKGAGAYLTELFDTKDLNKAAQAFDQTRIKAKTDTINDIKATEASLKSSMNSLGLLSAPLVDWTKGQLNSISTTFKGNMNTLLTDAVQIEHKKRRELLEKQNNIDPIAGLGDLPTEVEKVDEKGLKKAAKAAEEAASLRMAALKAHLSELKEAAETEVKIHKDKQNELDLLQKLGRVSLATYYSGLIEEIKLGAAEQEKGIKERIDAINAELGKVGNAKGDPKRKIELNKMLFLASQELTQLKLSTADQLRKIDEDEINKLNEVSGKTDIVIEKYNRLLSTLRGLKDVRDSKGKPIIDAKDFASIQDDLQNKIANEHAKPSEGLKSYNELIKDIIANTKDLGATNSGVFDAALGGFNQLAGALDNLSEHLEFYANKQLELNDKKFKAETENSKELDPVLRHARELDIAEKAAEAQKNLNSDIVKTKLAGVSQMLGAAEGMFKKESGAAKALHSLNIALSAARVAMDLVEMKSSIAKMYVNVAGGVAKMFEQSGWAGFAGAAGFLALMAGLGYSAFGGTSKQEMPTDSRTTGTVLGDSEAGSQSLSNVAELLKDIHAKEYRELVGINQSVTSMAAGIQDAVASVFRGGGLETTSAGFGKTIGVGVGGFAQTAVRTFDNIYNPVNLLVRKLPVVGKFMEAIDGFLFGTKKVELKAVGIETAITKLTNIAAGVNPTQFQINHVKKKGALGGLFGGNKEFDEQFNSPLDTETALTINKIFANAGNAIFGASKVFNNIFDEAINNYVLPGLKVDLKDLKGEDAAKKMQEAISTLLDTASGAIFDSLKQFQQLGEGMFETVNRIVIDVSVVRDSLKMVNTPLKLLGLDAISVAEAIVTASGGIKEARSNFENFFEKFFSDLDHQLYNFENLQGMLQDMNLTLPFSREGWKDLTQEMLRGGVATATTAARLLELTSSADEFYKFLEKGESRFQNVSSGGQNIIDKLIEQLNFLYVKFSNIFAVMSIDPNRTWAGFDNTMQQVVGAAKESLNASLYALDQLTASIQRGILDKTNAFKDLITTIGINTYQTLATARLSGDLNSADWNKQFAAQRKLETVRANVVKLEDALTHRQMVRFNAELNRNIAGEDFQDRYNRQFSALEKIQNLVQTKYDKELQLLTQTITAISGIQTHVRELLTNETLSPLSNTQMLTRLRQQFELTLQAAKGGDVTALGNVNSTLDAYLQQARTFYSSSEQYSKIFTQATTDALSLTDLALTTEEKIESNTANMVSELQRLQLKLDELELARQEIAVTDREALLAKYDQIAFSFLSSIQILVDKAAPGSGVDVGRSYGGTGSGTSGKSKFTTVDAKVRQENIDHFNSLIAASRFAEAAKFGLGKGYSKQAIAKYMSDVYGISQGDTMKWFAANGFAVGGAFTNGVVSRPTLFNTAVMGEKGSEGILPLSNVGGILGVHANIGGSRELIAEVRALRQEVSSLRNEAKQHTGDLIAYNYDATNKAAQTIVKGTDEATDKLNWKEKSKPALV